jgi:hypothetical protein
MNFWHPSSRLEFHSMTIVSLGNRVSPGLFEDVFSRSRVTVRLLINSVFAIVRLFGAYVEITLVYPPVPSVNAVQECSTKTLSGRHEFGVNRSVILSYRV